MTAWTKGITGAPRDRQILFRLPTWDCPAVIRFMQEDGETWWHFCESLIADVAGAVDDEELANGEWTLMPE